MLFKILRRIFGRHLKLHLLIPLVVALGLEYLAAVYSSWRVIGWREFLIRAALTALVVLLTYFVIMYGLIKKETSIRVSKVDLEVLKDSLSTAESFFATSTIPFKEWFDPVAQVYFSIIVNRRFQSTSFRHTRVFLFFREADIRNLESMYLDGYYSKCLAEMQQNYKVFPAFLKRDKLLSALNSLEREDDKKALGCRRFCIPYSISWSNRRVNFKKKYFYRWRSGRLDFALVALAGGKKHVLRVSKHGQDVRIEKLEEQNDVSPYEELVGKINDMIFKPGIEPLELRPEHNFSNLSPSI